MEHLKPERMIADLRAIADLTGGPDGARRLAWTDEWAKARAYVRTQLEQLPVEIAVDDAGNMWATLAGERADAVVVGSHVDSVPNGGWLDGVLGVCGGLEVLRALAAGTTPAVTVRLVDWADEEGARYGRSLLGSSAACLNMEPAKVRDLRDRDGIRLEDALAAHGVRVDDMHRANAQLADVRAYLELHIEQGPVLESEGLACAAVIGTVGVERFLSIFTGQAAHAGSTPMAVRRDSFLAAARLALEAREIAVRNDGRATTGGATSTPGIITAIAGRTELLTDLRHVDGATLATMKREVADAAARIATEERCEVELRDVWNIEPIMFDEDLVGAARRACADVAGSDRAIPSGPLHDAAEVAKYGIPTVMLFSSSTNGISHAKEEDTPIEHLEFAVRAFAQTVEHAIARVAAG